MFCLNNNYFIIKNIKSLLCILLASSSMYDLTTLVKLFFFLPVFSDPAGFGVLLKRKFHGQNICNSLCDKKKSLIVLGFIKETHLLEGNYVDISAMKVSLVPRLFYGLCDGRGPQ